MDCSSQRRKITVLGHCQQQALLLVQSLQRIIAARPGADPSALIWQASCQAKASEGSDLCLLMPWSQGGATLAEAPLEDLKAHQDLRSQLHHRNQPFEVLRGGPSDWMRQALASLSRWQPVLRPEGAQTLARPGWQSVCENCDDPDCELRLFAALGPAASNEPGLHGQGGKRGVAPQGPRRNY